MSSLCTRAGWASLVIRGHLHSRARWPLPAPGGRACPGPALEERPTPWFPKLESPSRGLPSVSPAVATLISLLWHLRSIPERVRSFNVFCGLLSEITYSDFCNILLVTQLSTIQRRRLPRTENHRGPCFPACIWFLIHYLKARYGSYLTAVKWKNELTNRVNLRGVKNSKIYPISTKCQ